MRVIREPDLPTFAEQVLPHLLTDPVRNNVACDIVQSRLDGRAPVEPNALWLRVQDGHAVTGVALMTPPHVLLLTDMPPAAVDALVAHLADPAAPLPGVNGPATCAARFAHAYRELMGTHAELVMRYRMFRLDTVTAPLGVPGRLREATRADRDLLTGWSMAFIAEALPQEGPADATRTGRLVDARLRRPGAQWLWEVDGEPVCTAILSAPVAGVVRVSGVYTPPDRRGRGYASACVAAVSQRALDAGASACMLYTDVANPVSNSIYPAIGYRPVGDTQEWRFDAPPA